MIRRPTRSTRTDTLFPYTTLFRSSHILQLPLITVEVGRLSALTHFCQLADAPKTSNHVRVMPYFYPVNRAFLMNKNLLGFVGVLLLFFAISATLVGYSVWKRSEEHTSELQSLMRISYAVFCLKKKKYY